MVQFDYTINQNYSFPEMNIYTANVTENNKNNFVSGSGIYNVAVSDKYLRDVASDPEKSEEFKQTLRDMKEATDNGVRFQKGRNVDLYASGFILDEDGGMSSWSSMKTLDPEKNTLNNAFGTQNSNNKSLMDRLDNNREQRKLEEQQREAKRLEKRDLERREQKKEDEQRLEEQREEKRMEEKRQLEQINNENILNSSVNKVVVDKYKNDINFENNLSDFNTEI